MTHVSEPVSAAADESITRTEQRLQDLKQSVVAAAAHLPPQGPIDVFVYLNTLQGFEHLPFHEGVQEAMRLHGAQPYLSETRYQDMLLTGRIDTGDLEAIVSEDLGERDGEVLPGLGRLHDLRMAMLRHSLQGGTNAELRWMVAETDALVRFRDDVPYRIREQLLDHTRDWLTDTSPQNGADVKAELLNRFGIDCHTWNDVRWESALLFSLWQICRTAVADLVSSDTVRRNNRTSFRSDTSPHPQPFERPRDILLHATGDDPDRYVHGTLIRFCGAFLDQGYADWTLPDRNTGFFKSFISIYRHSKGPIDRWIRNLKSELTALRKQGMTAEQSILDSLDLLGVPEQDRDAFIRQSLLALGGWAGMIWQMETVADWIVWKAPRGTLLEFLAVRLILDHQAVLYFGEEYLGCNSSAREVLTRARTRLRPPEPKSIDRRAFQIFQLAQLMGWHPQQLLALDKSQWSQLLNEVETFSGLQRRRLLHEAYERHYRQNALDAIAIHSTRRREIAAARDAEAAGTPFNVEPNKPLATGRNTPNTADPANRTQSSDIPQRRRNPATWQIVTCIDEREESFRRNLEEVDPTVQTFGAAGFFAVVMYYRGAADAYFKALCPNIITPKHYVTEDVGYTFEGVNRQRASSRKRLGQFSHQVHQRSRTFIGGILTGLFGSLATFPLVARVLFPRLTSQIRKRFGQLIQPPPVTQLQLERYEQEPGQGNGHVGFTLDEMAGIVQRLLQDIGLTRTEDFARLVMICGHGASSLNNPHESAYCCGACAGKRGGPNARAFAHMANDWRIRARLSERGLKIPDDTTFLGAYHDTTSDSVVFFDLDRMPASHRSEFERIQSAIAECRERNAHERCRRFGAASLTLSQAEALRHVETRGEDLSQVRPEYDHATNALCLVGRRDWSRGLFLDRRSFLASYDPRQDDEHSSILLRILAPAIPVCAGINLSFYFSTVDPVHYGSGSKLPHNLVSLLGVMEGASSDLRTGVYQQVTELHEPMRILFVIESTPEAMLSIMDRNEIIGRLCRNGWVQLAVIDYDTSDIQLFRNGRFEPFVPSTSKLPTVDSSVSWYRRNREHLGFATVKELS